MSKMYKVHITEILGRDVYVEAEDTEEATEKIQLKYYVDEIVLDGKDFCDSYIEVIGEVKDGQDK